MIQFARAEIQGESFELPLRNGKSLCSFRNPQQEAERWLRNAGKLNSSVIYVIGLGAGFHVDLLLQSFQGEVRVLELEVALIEKYHQTHSPCHRLTILEAHKENATLRKWIHSSTVQNFPILDFRASWVDDETNYGELRGLLTGRIRESIALQKSNDGFRCVNLEKLPTDRLLSAREIVQSWTDHNYCQEQKLWLTLQELLK